MARLTNAEEQRFREYVGCGDISFDEKDKISKRWAEGLQVSVDLVNDWNIRIYRSKDSDSTFDKYVVKCNKNAQSEIKDILTDISNLGADRYKILSVGIYDYRNVDKTDSLSLHALGLAIDINAGSKGNPWYRETKKVPDSEVNNNDNTRIRTADHPVVKIFERYNWKWGGSYGDTMHFSFCGR